MGNAWGGWPGGGRGRGIACVCLRGCDAPAILPALKKPKPSVDSTTIHSARRSDGVRGSLCGWNSRVAMTRWPVTTGNLFSTMLWSGNAPSPPQTSRSGSTVSNASSGARAAASFARGLAFIAVFSTTDTTKGMPPSRTMWGFVAIGRSFPASAAAWSRRAMRASRLMSALPRRRRARVAPHSTRAPATDRAAGIAQLSP
mmetsp:Transcript_23904/g.90353  ORF Transcript_23904/g.90353 Transcript_23904/m.90353 type:complete len:200 (+) Transcript_23904:488-1087(+)